MNQTYGLAAFEVVVHAWKLSLVTLLIDIAAWVLDVDAKVVDVEVVDVEVVDVVRVVVEGWAQYFPLYL